MNAANPDSASEAISDESDDLIAELARIVARDAHAGRQDLEPKMRQPPPIPAAPARAATQETPAQPPTRNPEEILTEGFRAIAEPPMPTPDHAAPPGSGAEAPGSGATLPPLRPADLGLTGAEPAPSGLSTQPEAVPQDQGAGAEHTDLPTGGEDHAPTGAGIAPAPASQPTPEAQTSAEASHADRAAGVDPIADPIADLIAAAEAEESRAAEAPTPAQSDMPPPVAEAKPVEPAPEPKPVAPAADMQADEPAAETADRFETPPAMRATPADKPAPRAAAVDPLDEIERLIAETTAFDLPSSSDAKSPAWEPKADVAETTTRKSEAKSAPTGRSLDAAAETADAAIEASVAVSRSADEADKRPGASAFATALGGGLGRFIVPATAGLVIVALIGGAWWYFNQEGGLFGEVPVVTAPDDAVKQPAPETAATDERDSIVFNQLEGAETASPEDEALVSRDQTGGESGEGLAGVITPESDTGGLANRKVRTVTVRADGTIVSGDEATAGIEPLPALRPNVPDVPGAPAIEENDPDAIGDVLNALAEEEPGLLGEPSTPTVPTVPTAPTALVSEGVATTAPPASPPAADTQEPINVANVNPAPVPIPRPGQLPDEIDTSAPTTTASTGVVTTPPPAPDQPLALEQPASSPVVTASGAPFYVQLSSQRTESAARATATDLTERLASVLGPVQLEIQRVDLGDRGIFFRVKAPAASLNDARDLCSQVKVAGADCFVRSD